MRRRRRMTRWRRRRDNLRVVHEIGSNGR